MFFRQIILILCIALVLNQALPIEVRTIIAGNYTVQINLRGGSFKILANHEEQISFNPQELIEKNLDGMAIANRTVSLDNKLFSVYEADYNKTHPVKYIRLTSESLSKDTETFFQTTITLHKNKKNIYYTEAPANSFEISHEIKNWRSCHNTGNSTTDKPECHDAEMKNYEETFIDYNMEITHMNNATMNETRNDNVISFGNDETITYKDTYNIQPGKSIRPSWEQGYPMFKNFNHTDSAAFSFRFKKPVLHKYDNSVIWFNYVYFNKKELVSSVSAIENETKVNLASQSIGLNKKNEDIFEMKFNQLSV